MRRFDVAVVNCSRPRRSDSLPERLDVVQHLEVAAHCKRPPQRPFQEIQIGECRDKVAPQQSKSGRYRRFRWRRRHCGDVSIRTVVDFWLFHVLCVVFLGPMKVDGTGNVGQKQGHYGASYHTGQRDEVQGVVIAEFSGDQYLPQYACQTATGQECCLGVARDNLKVGVRDNCVDVSIVSHLGGRCRSVQELDSLAGTWFEDHSDNVI